MNQRSRQKATTDVKNYFYKLLSNLNFGIDCKSNINSRTLEPLYDELGEITFIKKYDDMFDRRNYYQFADPDIMREDINKKFDRLTLILNKSDPWYEVRKESYELQKESDLNAVNNMEDRRKRTGKKTVFYNIDDKIDHVAKSKITKIILDFCVDESVSIKSFAVKGKKQVRTTTRFLSGKVLMFAKLSLMSFICDILETFCFPDKKVKKIYEKYQIENVYIYHILTDTTPPP